MSSSLQYKLHNGKNFTPLSSTLRSVKIIRTYETSPRRVARVAGKPGSNKRDAKIREVQEGECGHMLNAAIS